MVNENNTVLLRKIYTIIMSKQDYTMTREGYAYQYPRAAVTTDCVIFGFDGQQLQVLLIERGVEPYKGEWALPGGFLRMDESVEECAFRELREETSLEPVALEQFGVFSGVDRDPRGRVITIAFYALVKKEYVQGGDDAVRAQWFGIDQLPRLAFDHSDILKEARQALKRDIHHQPVAFRLLAEHFTMPQLQRLYENILRVKFDRRNFQKKMIATGVVEEKQLETAHTGHRPGKLFSFNLFKYDKMKEDGVGSSEF